MVLGVGTDLVLVERFMRWQNFKQTTLLKLFQSEELSYAYREQDKIDYRFLAVSFALKEACYKALSTMLVTLRYVEYTISFLSATRAIRVTKNDWGIPEIQVSWHLIEEKIKRRLPAVRILCSVSHEGAYVQAFVVIDRESELFSVQR